MYANKVIGKNEVYSCDELAILSLTSSYRFNVREKLFSGLVVLFLSKGSSRGFPVFSYCLDLGIVCSYECDRELHSEDTVSLECSEEVSLLIDAEDEFAVIDKTAQIISRVSGDVLTWSMNSTCGPHVCYPST